MQKVWSFWRETLKLLGTGLSTSMLCIMPHPCQNWKVNCTILKNLKAMYGINVKYARCNDIGEHKDFKRPANRCSVWIDFPHNATTKWQSWMEICYSVQQCTCNSQWWEVFLIFEKELLGQSSQHRHPSWDKLLTLIIDCPLQQFLGREREVS